MSHQSLEQLLQSAGNPVQMLRNSQIGAYVSPVVPSEFSYNERSGLSLGVVDPNINIGDVLTLVWGEEGGGTKKTTVERHKQLEFRVKVSPVPYASAAREGYHEGWRTRSA